MNFLHTEFEGGPGDFAVVTINGQCNVMLLDDPNFSAYRRCDSFKYYGGWARLSPVRLAPPHRGRWHVVVDLGGRSGSVRANVRIVNSN